MNNQAATQPVKKREIFGWAMYDFANSSYTTVVVTFIYSAFFVSYIVPPELAHMKNTFWSLAVAISTTLAIFLAPLVGVLCDYSGKKKKYLAVCTFISIFSTAALFFVGPGSLWFGLTLLVLSNTAWMLSESFIASFLPELATDKNMGKVSGIGWGIGYVGGLLSLLLMASFITADKITDYDLFVSQNQMAMVFIALFYFLGALPTFLFVKERATPKPGFEQANFSVLFRAAVARILDMKNIIKDYPVLFKFFLAFMMYSAGIAVVVKFFGIYAQEEIGINGTALLLIGATLQVSSMLGAVGFGFIEDRIGSKQTIFLSLGWWIAGILGIYFLDPLVTLTGMEINNLFVVVAFIAGSAMGATQSASRAVVGLLAMPKDSALLFGLWGTFGRFAIIIGMTFGPISDAIGRHSGLLFILVYFVIGGIMLALVPLNQALHKRHG
ncbi:MFS transporter [Reinekea marina]|uniref:MFS transporter n=1 Tax=Reinekea marina TaxID=1310421 RepID=A0ABV7WPV3_9GAMM|nr:MFS transporter [Reinekea marina]MDN3649419.1 MFS transporter [Reinekea marina]